MDFEGQLTAKVLEVRFAFSGKLVLVRKKEGDFVNKGEVIASLDRMPLQADLDRQLANSEKARADFNIFNLKTPNPDALNQHLKKSQQADLDASVIQVEQAKYRLDQADLISPINGQVVDMGGNCVGLNITPSSNAVNILDTDHVYFKIKLKSHQTHLFANPGLSLPIDFKERGLKITAVATGLPYPDEDFDYWLDFQSPDFKDLPLGLSGILILP